jgi:hypothetical protein
MKTLFILVAVIGFALGWVWAVITTDRYVKRIEREHGLFR